MYDLDFVLNECKGIWDYLSSRDPYWRPDTPPVASSAVEVPSGTEANQAAGSGRWARHYEVGVKRKAWYANSGAVFSLF